MTFQVKRGLAPSDHVVNDQLNDCMRPRYGKANRVVNRKLGKVKWAGPVRPKFSRRLAWAVPAHSFCGPGRFSPIFLE